MNIVQITPGAGGMYCGNCFRDNALVGALRTQGHYTLMVPLYLPLTLDEEDQSAGSPIFFSGVNVYLEQKSAFFRRAPAWLHRLLGSRRVLEWAAKRAARTRAADVGDLTLSMLRGEEGNQAREISELAAWLKTQERPEVICLSNALLIGMARQLRSELGVTMVCMLQGEDTFLDALPDSHRARAWQTIAERAADVDLFVTPSRYFGDLMSRRLGLTPDRVRVVPNGIDLRGYEEAQTPQAKVQSRTAPVLGYLARMCKEKGLETLVDAFILLKQSRRVGNLKLRIAGGCGPSDEPFVKTLRQKLAAAGYIGETSFLPNLNRSEKLEFLQSLSVFSVPALYGEAFGLYVIEALAAGVPVVEPRTAAFPELIEATGGGVLCEPNNPQSLATAIEGVLQNSAKAAAMGRAGQAAVFANFSAEQMARNMAACFEEARQRR